MERHSMKKIILATALAALTLSSANAAPEIYGKAFMTLNYVKGDFDYDEGAAEAINEQIIIENALRDEEQQLPLLQIIEDADDDKLDIRSEVSRIGFRGSEAMTANTDVTYKLEYGIDIDGDKTATLTRRGTYLGIKNDTWGELRAGNQTIPLNYINGGVIVAQGYWDNLGTQGGEPSLAKALNMVSPARRSNTLLWKSPKFDAVPVALNVMYRAEEAFDDSADNGFSVSALYAVNDGLKAGIAYDKDIAVDGDLMRATVAYDASDITGLPIKLGALYQQTDFDIRDDDEVGYVLSGEMGIDSFAKPASIYAQYNHTSDLAGNNGLDSDQFVIGGKYMFQKNMIGHSYGGYNKTANDRSEAKLFAIGAGLEYLF